MVMHTQHKTDQSSHQTNSHHDLQASQTHHHDAPTHYGRQLEAQTPTTKETSSQHTNNSPNTQEDSRSSYPDTQSTNIAQAHEELADTHLHNDVENLRERSEGREVIGRKRHKMDVGTTDDNGTSHSVDGDINQYDQDINALKNELNNGDNAQHPDPNFNSNLQKDNQNVQMDSQRIRDDQSNLCFLSGTRISTIEGEKPVEALAIGDTAITSDGTRKTIQWIGHQDVIFNKNDERPVCIKRHAFAKNVPYKDLYVSAAHGLAFKVRATKFFFPTTKSILARAASLINGSTILSTNIRHARYWHIELTAGHDVLIANGAPAESFADHGERQFFSNVSHTSHQKKKRTQDCLPRLKRGKYIRAIRSYLNQRAYYLALNDKSCRKQLRKY